MDKLQGETHQKQSCGFPRLSSPWDTYAGLEQTCKDVVRNLAERIKGQQEKIDCMLLELEAVEREQRHSPIQENAYEAQRMEHRGRTAERVPRVHHSESRAWRSRTKSRTNDEGNGTSSSRPKRERDVEVRAQYMKDGEALRRKVPPRALAEEDV